MQMDDTPKKLSFLEKRKNIQITIQFAFLFTLLVTSLSIISYSFHRSSRTVFDLATNQMYAASQNVMHTTLNYLKPANICTQLLARMVKDKENIFESKDELTKQLVQMLQMFPQIDGFYNGDEHGNLLAVSRLGSNPTYQFTKPATPLPTSSAFTVRTIDRRTGTVVEMFNYVDNEARALASEQRPPSAGYFDPRVRPWYMGSKAKKSLYWTDMYIYDITHDIGVTAARPVYGQNHALTTIVSADMTVKEISRQLGEQKAGKTGIIFITTSKGDIIAYPDITKTSKLVNNQLQIPHISDLDKDQILESFNRYTQDRQEEFFFNANNIRYIAKFLPLPEEFGKDWIIGVVVPYDEFLGDTKATTINTILFSIVVLFASMLFIVVLARNISKPIVEMAGEMRKIQRFDIEESNPVRSYYYEIRLMNESLIIMKQGLKAFGKFVPKALVQQLIETGTGAELGGVKREITLMFTDIAGFTSISETMTTENLMKHLSAYFEALSQIITREKGTIDKFIGDALMCFWGAPQEDKDQTSNACRTALLCIKELNELNHRWPLEGTPAFPTRFGLHTGSAIVGNLGSSDRMNYTAIGDSVNLASRLEGANKFYGTTVIASHEVFRKAHNAFFFRPIDIVTVKGKSEGVKIYELLGEQNPDSPLYPESETLLLTELTREAFEVYLGSEWEKALKLYKQIHKKFPDDKVASLYIERCSEYIKTPPGDEWRGVYHLTSK